MKKFLFISILFFSAIGFAQTESLFEQGNTEYSDKQYQKAITSWKKILENGQHSAELYYNLGNAHYKLNEIGPSIYYFEKARQLAPNDEDIKNNLAFAENARVDAIEPLPKTIFSRWYASIAQIFTYEGWAICSVIGSFAFVGLFLLYYFSASETKKRIFFVASLIFLGGMLLTSVMAFSTYNDVKNNRPAIIFSESVQVKSGPTANSDNAFLLHEGTKVQIISDENDWVRVELLDGKDGWLPAAALRAL